VKKDAYGVYFIFKSMEVGPTFRITVSKYPTKDPNYRILANQWSRFTHYYFYIHHEVLGPIVMRAASFFPFRTTYYLNGTNFIEHQLRHGKIRTPTPLWPLTTSPPYVALKFASVTGAVASLAIAFRMRSRWPPMKTPMSFSIWSSTCPSKSIPISLASK